MWTYEAGGMVVYGFSYDGAVDQRRMRHLVDLLLVLLRFWSPSFMKVLFTTNFLKSVSTDLFDQAANSASHITLTADDPFLTNPQDNSLLTSPHISMSCLP